MRQQFAQQANMVGAWIEKQMKAVSATLQVAQKDQQASLKQCEQEVVAYKPHMDELEACNQAVQEAMIFENPHTNYTMEVNYNFNGWQLAKMKKSISDMSLP